MIKIMIICGLVLLISITSTKILYKFGVPILLIFIILGMIFGSDGIVGIYFNDYQLTNKIAIIALIFIMFFGGFGTNWKMAKPVAKPSILLSTLGVIFTSGLTGLLCFFIFKTTLLEGLLIGAIVGSTDAASVFAILRSQRLNLKGSIASMLELESGSNDPCAYMLTAIILMLISNNNNENIFIMTINQILFGIVIAIILAKLSVYLLRKFKFEIEGFYLIFITAIAILSYSLSEYLGGNGYLCVYITGIIIGNSKIPHKKSIFQFLDGISWLMQITLFFVLGLLAFPSRIPLVMEKGILISLFMIFVARPISIFSILYWFNVPIKQQIFISWVGIRGAASIVFAIFAETYGVSTNNDIFHIIFFIALFSVVAQGTITPILAKKLDLIDNDESVLKTFNDYKENKSTSLIEFTIDKNNSIANKMIMDANIPEDILVVMIKRNGDVFVPNGSTKILPGDILVLSGNKLKYFNEYREEKSTTLTEFSVDKKSCLINKPIKDADVLGRVLIVMIKRDGEVLVPNGNTVILEDDILVVTSNNVKELEKLLKE